MNYYNMIHINTDRNIFSKIHFIQTTFKIAHKNVKATDYYRYTVVLYLVVSKH